MKITIESIAEQCHQANKHFCESIGDFSQQDWRFAPEWQQESAINGVKAHIDSGLTMTPLDSHTSWMKEKIENGWVYGEVKDPDLKTHPCIVPYAELPVYQRVKDYIFMHTVHAMAGFIE